MCGNCKGRDMFGSVQRDGHLVQTVANTRKGFHPCKYASHCKQGNAIQATYQGGPASALHKVRLPGLGSAVLQFKHDNIARRTQRHGCLKGPKQ